MNAFAYGLPLLGLRRPDATLHQQDFLCCMTACCEKLVCQVQIKHDIFEAHHVPEPHEDDSLFTRQGCQA